MTMLCQFELEAKVEQFISQLDREHPDIKPDHEKLKNSIMGLLNAELHSNSPDLRAYLSQILMQLGILEYQNDSIFPELIRYIHQRNYPGQGPDVDNFLRQVHKAILLNEPKRNSYHADPQLTP